MAKSLSIRLGADVAKLDAALSGAKVSLRGLDQAAEKSAGQLKRLMEGNSGSKLIADAHAAAEAYKRLAADGIGLTAREQAKLNATISEGIAKYRAMSVEVPAHLQKIADATAKVDAAGSGGGGGGLFSSIMSGAVAGGVAAVGTAAIGAATALGRMAVQGVGDLVARGQQVSGLKSAFMNLAGGVGAADKMIGQVRGSTQGLVDDFSIMGAANKAMLLGVTNSSEEMAELARTAAVLGRAMGQDAAKSLDDLIVALGRSSPMILDNLGLSVKVGKANEEYARTLGKTADALTDQEKKQAFMNAALEAARGRVAELGDVNLTFGDRLAVVGNAFRNLLDAISEGIASSPVLNTALGAIGEALTGAFGENKRGLVDLVTKAVNTLAFWIVDAARYAVEFGKVGAQAFGVFQVPVRAAAVAVVGLAEGFARFVASSAELAAKLPGVGDSFTGIAAAARGNVDALAGMRVEAVANLGVAWDMARGQGAVHEGLEKVSGVLLNVRARMVEASLVTQRKTAVTKQHAAATADSAGATERNEKAEKAAAKAAADHAKALADLTGADKVDKAFELAANVGELAAAGRKLDPGKILEINKALSEAIGLAPGLKRELSGAFLVLASDMQAAASAARGFRLPKLEAATELKSNPALAGVFGGTRIPGELLGASKETGKAAAASWLEGFGDNFGSRIAETILGAFQGGGDVGKSLGARFGGALFSGLGKKAGAALATGIGGTLGKGLGDAIGAMIPGLGSLLGSALGGLIGKLFGPSEGKLAARARSDYLSSVGGSEGFNAQLRNAGISGSEAASLTQGFLSANTRGAVERSIARINEAIARNTKLLEQQKATETEIASLEAERARLAESLVPTWDQLTRILDRYKINADGLGVTFNQIGATATFTSMINDLEALQRAGADVGGALFGMREEISAAVNESLRLGTEVPENWRPYVEELARSGNLLDANGEAIRDNAAALQAVAGIRWGAPVETEAQKTRSAMDRIDASISTLVEKLGEIVDRLANKVPDAAGAAARGIERNLSGITVPPIRIAYEYEGGPELPTAHTGAVVTPIGLRRFHAGGLAAHEMLAVLEAGEMVLSKHTTARLSNAARERIETGGGPAGDAGEARANIYLDGDLLTSVVLSRARRKLAAYGVAA